MSPQSGADIVVRPAEARDSDAVVEMLAKLAVEHDGFVSYDLLRQGFEYVVQNPEEVWFCVAECGGKVVGMASVHRGYSTWRARPCGIVHDVYVAEEARRMGVGTALFDCLRDRAAAQGYCRLEVEVLRDNDIAKAFYAGYGFRDSGYMGCSLYLDAGTS